jgi:2-polyprenyl-3-methyl-5-hydroxy-6-metoxy-1,4-benzoquinol methylase
MKVMNNFNCWICKSTNIKRVKVGLEKNIKPEDFNITDDRYGTTLPIYRCLDCKFEFCPEAIDLNSMYEDMEDDSYVETSKSRSIQAKKIAEYANKFIDKNSKVLDVGCGTGLLVKEFANLNYESYGLEPSNFLAQEGNNNNLTIYRGTLDNFNFFDEFNFLSLIDVIEHVQDPEELLNKIHHALDKDGHLLVITPRHDSFFRFILGFNWWHYRIAHVGYFSKKNLIKILTNTGFDIVDYKHATWYLPLDYILNRILKYAPFIKYRFSFTKEISFPINLLDSSMVMVKKSQQT